MGGRFFSGFAHLLGIWDLSVDLHIRFFPYNSAKTGLRVRCFSQKVKKQRFCGASERAADHFTRKLTK